MKRFQARLQGASLGAVFAYLAVTWFVVTYGISLLDHTGALTPTYAIIRAVTSLLFAGIMTAVIARQRRRSGGVGMVVAVNKALKSGKLPYDAEPAAWEQALVLRRTQTARSTWLSPLVFGLFAVLGVWLIVQDPADISGWVTTVILVVLAIVITIVARRQLRQIDVLLAELHEAPGVARG